MKVVVRGEGLTPVQGHALVSTVRTTFCEVVERITSVLVVVSTPAERRHAARNCKVEVHMADGHVECVEERQRRLGSALRRAVQRAWKAAVNWFKRQMPIRPEPPRHHAVSSVQDRLCSSTKAHQSNR